MDNELPFLGMDLVMSIRTTLILQMRKLRIKSLYNLAKVTQLISREAFHHHNAILFLQEAVRWQVCNLEAEPSGLPNCTKLLHQCIWGKWSLLKG